MSPSVGWRSTTLNMVAKHCPKTLDFLAAGAPYDRTIFGTGASAHAVLEEIGKESARRKDYLTDKEAEAVAERVCRELIQYGRLWEGGAGDPPLPSTPVFRGRDLALAYQKDWPLPHDGDYEIGIAVNRQWQPCPYDKGAWLRVLIDMKATRMPSWVEEDEDDSGPILLIRDYKSAWSTGEDDLYTIQRKAQACVGWIYWGEGHEALKLEVVNFRTGKPYETTVLPNTPEGAEVLRRWQRDIEIEISSREGQTRDDGTHPAVPGAGCVGCPYLHQCAEGKAYSLTVFGSDDPHEMAVAYAQAEAMTKSLSGPLKKLSDEDPIVIPGGIVGTMAEEQRALQKDAFEKLAAVWLRKAHPATLEAANAQIPGLLKALGLGVAQVEKLLTFLYKDSEEEREKRQRLLASMLTKKVAKKFGLHKVDERIEE